MCQKMNVLHITAKHEKTVKYLTESDDESVSVKTRCSSYLQGQGYVGLENTCWQSPPRQAPLETHRMACSDKPGPAGSVNMVKVIKQGNLLTKASEFSELVSIIVLTTKQR